MTSQDPGIPAIQIIHGPPADITRSRFFTQRVLKASLEQNAATLYLVPSHRKRSQINTMFAIMGGGFPPRIMQFDQLFEKLYRATGHSESLISGDAATFALFDVLSNAIQSELFQAVPTPLPTAGFVRESARHIFELERAGFRSEDLMALPDAMEGYGVYLAGVFEAYEAFLHAHHWLDPFGMQLAVRDMLCRQTDPPDIRHRLPWTRLIIDGFTDFTDPQLELLQVLCRFMETHLFWSGIDGDATVFQPTRIALQAAFPDARWMTHDTFDRQQGWLPAQTLPPENSLTTAARSFASEHPIRETVPVSGELRVIEARTIRDEVIAIARDIKHRITSDDPPALDQMCVTFPNLQTYAPLIRRIFMRYGIPYAIGQPLPFTSSSIFATIRTILAIPPEFHRIDLLALLQDPLVLTPLHGNGFIPHRELDTWSRALKMIRGKQRWLEKLRWKAGLLRNDQKNDPAARLEMFTEKLAELFAILEPLQEPDTLPHHLEKLRTVLDRFQIHRQLENLAGEYAHGSEAIHDQLEYSIRAYRRLITFFDEIEPVLARLDTSRIIPFQEFREMLPQLFSDIEYPLSNQSETGIPVMGLLEVRGLTFDHVYLGGLTESAFPAREPPSAFWNLPVRNLILHLPARYTYYQSATDMVRILLTPTTSLTISRPMWEGEETILPSPLWTRLLEVCTGQEPVVPPPLPLNTLEDMRCRTRTIRSGPVESWPRSPAYRSMILGLAAELDRKHPIGTYSGDLSSHWPALIGNRFDPSEPMGVTMLESYLNCPKIFFFQNLLNVQESREPEEMLDPLEIGTFIHHVLHMVYRERIQAGAGRVAESDRETATERFREIARQYFTDHDFSGIYADEDLSMIIGHPESRYSGLAGLFTETESKIDPNLQPRWLEWRFGFDENQPVIFDKPGYDPVKLRGVIDRVDAWLPTGSHVIYDYKTGKCPKSDDINGFKSIQIPVYMAAFQQIHHVPADIGCYYQVSVREGCRIYPVKGRHTASAASLLYGSRQKPDDPSTFDTYFDQLVDVILQAARNIRTGMFPDIEDESLCGDCRLHDLCRKRINA